MMPNENLAALRMAYDALIKAGSSSLSAAFDFGQIIDALSNIYTLGVMGEELGRHPTTIGRYAKLYRMYPNKQALLHMAQEMGTWDVNLLISTDVHVIAHKVSFGYKCQNCGSFDTKRTKRLQTEGDTIPEVKFNDGH